jgi:molybdate transport system substrate-binding protein
MIKLVAKEFYMKRFLSFVLIMASLAAAGFAGGKKQAAAGEPQAAAPEPQVTITLAAAASLEKAFTTDLIPAWLKDHPNVTIEGVYDSSGRLQTQIENGLAADVFFSAATRQMNALVDGGYIEAGAVVPLLENKIALIKPQGKTTTVTAFDNIQRAAVIAVGDPKVVPAGQYAQEALTKIGNWDAIQSKISLGSNVTEVLNWVAEASAEVGIVYATDAAAQPKVEVITPLPDGILTTPVLYPVAPLKAASLAKEARDFIAFLQSPLAVSIFEKYGFAVVK